MNCTRCGHSNDPDAEFCENCGSPLALVCEKCGAALRPTARFCKKCGAPVGPSASFTPPPASGRLTALRQAAPSDLKQKLLAISAQSEGERKPVTILFADIVDSMTLAAQLDPEAWRAIVNEVHQRISSVVYRYEGIVAQLLGDGVLAFFGAPITHEDDPVRAVRAALDIRAAMNEYTQSAGEYTDGVGGYTGGAGRSLHLRLGLSTGTVVVGAVGGDLHLEYLAIGDAVNLASRLQSAAEPGQILVAETTARLVRPVFDLHPLSELVIKGLPAPVRAFAVAGPKVASGRERGIEGRSSPLVGREPELASLHQALSMLGDGHGQVVFVLGEAGIGKSRLVEEIRRQQPADGAHPIRWLEGRALSYGQALSFWMISQLIQGDLGVSNADSETVIRTALHQRLETLFAEQAHDALPYLTHLLGLKLEGEGAERVAELDGETLKRQALLVMSSYFAAIADRQPTVLVCEDTHWADASTLEALAQLLAQTNRSPLMLLVLARAERDHGVWQLKHRAETDFAHRLTELHLKPLSAAEGNQLVDNLLDVADLGENVRRLVLDHAEGNPLYLEELIRSLIEQGVLVRENHHWSAARPISDVDIPNTLEGVLLARIDRLPDRTRRTLQIASVVGRSFLYRLLAAIAEANGDLDGHLAKLQSADLVREQARRPELEYTFKHALTQEAAYNSLLIERRREYHRRVGLALEDLFDGRREEYLGLLARHFDLAGERDKAVTYLLQAGDKARLSDAHVEAVKYYQRAIQLLEAGETGGAVSRASGGAVSRASGGAVSRASGESDDRQAAATWLKLGMVYHTNFEFDLAHQANEAAFALQQKIRAGASAEVRPMAPPEARPMAPPEAPDAPPPPAVVLRGGIGELGVLTLDPGQVALGSEAQLVFQLFAGLAEFDAELNLLPHAARSWQVLDGGVRYLIHLRHDVRWSDGTRLTAADFEWAWKHNLRNCQGEYPAKALDDIVGAREYREKRHNDPERVGVRALDDTTLEVRLVSPVAYFPYLFALPITFPLPRAGVERYGDDWWKPEHFVGNGAYVLGEFDPKRLAVAERNPTYFGDFGGNVDRIEWLSISESEVRQERYLAGELDFAELRQKDITPDLVPRIIPAAKPLHCSYLTLAPHPPLDDVRVRRALVHALDREALAKLRNTQPAWGGLIPSGMPGHSPELALPYAPDLARRLLAEAGYPEGRGFPVLCGVSYSSSVVDEVPRLWREVLSIEAHLEPGKLKNWRRHDCLIYMHGWIADYPDPDAFMRQASCYEFLRDRGWRDARYSELVDAAARTTDRARRLALYRQADRVLVSDQVLVVPLDYGVKRAGVVAQPWVKGMRVSPLGYLRHRTIVVEPRSSENMHAQA